MIYKILSEIVAKICFYADKPRAADIIVLATKPASYEGILRLIAPELAGKILLLLAPNFKLECAQNIVGADVFVARAMPNVAAGIGASATASILMRLVGRSYER